MIQHHSGPAFRRDRLFGSKNVRQNDTKCEAIMSLGLGRGKTKVLSWSRCPRQTPYNRLANCTPKETRMALTQSS